MSLEPGDRVCWKSTGDDGLPTVRYGFVRSVSLAHERVVLMLDDEIKSDTVVAADEVELVSITAVELRLRGVDLLDDPALRGGLVSLWSAEAEAAGLDIEVRPLVKPFADTNGGGWVIAEVDGGSGHFMLHSFRDNQLDLICVRADPPSMFQGYV